MQLEADDQFSNTKFVKILIKLNNNFQMQNFSTKVQRHAWSTNNIYF